MNDDRRATAVNVAVVVAKAGTPAAGVGCLHFQLDIARKTFDLVPNATARVEAAEAQLGEVGHKNVVQVDEHGLIFHYIDGDNAQRHKHGIGVGGLDGPGDGRTWLGLEVDIAANQVNLVGDAFD